jgi:cytochrome c-type biogenesis protein
MNVSIGLAFLAGLASFLSPCVFSLVPAYIGYLSGRSIAASQSETRFPGKWETFLHGLAFVFGFSIVFILLGIAASMLGGILFYIKPWLMRIGGILILCFGLHMTGLLRIPFLEYDLRPQSKSDQRRSLISSALMGIFFSAGWSPCIGPVLGSILTLAMNGGSIPKGVSLLSAYSAGLAIPFLVAALGIGWVTIVIKRYKKVMHYVEIIMGIILMLVGVLLFFGKFSDLSQFGLFVDFGL